MYCVKCGVKLQEGVGCCPLCGTPVWNPDDQVARRENYPCEYPDKPYNERIPGLAFATVIIAALCLSCLIACLRTYGSMAWSGYVILGTAVFYVIILLPRWFRHPHPMIFVPVSFAAVCGCLLYICQRSGGHWFWSFAFPSVMLVGLLTTGAVALYRYIKRHRLIITGGVLMAIGAASMLVELFEDLTFHTGMFNWSLYSATAFGIFGLFLLLAGIIRPLREHLEKKFFL